MIKSLNKSSIIIILVSIAAALGSALAPAFTLVLLLAVFSVALIFWLSHNLIIGWYVLVGLSPLITWEVNLNWLSAWFPNSPWLYSMHAPVMEAWALVLTFSFALHVIRRLKSGAKFEWFVPAGHWFLLFVLSAIVSLIPLTSREQFAGAKYIIHFFGLLYAYVVLGANIINTKEEWRRSLVILALVGGLGALFGVAGIVGDASIYNGFRRATPLVIFGWKPFGDHHIFLAELMTTVWPLFLYLWARAVVPLRKKLWAAGIVLVAAVGLLTLSRAAVLTLFLELVIFVFVGRSAAWWQAFKKRWLYLSVAVSLPILAYLFLFLTQARIVSESTSLREQLTEFSLSLWRERPLIGVGVGTFISRETESQLFRRQLSAPLDPHGLIQKLLAEQGLFGLVAFILFVGSLTLVVLERYRSEDYSAEARDAYLVALFLVVAPLFFQFFNTHYYTSKVWVPIALAVSQSLLYKQDSRLRRFTINLELNKSRFVREV